MHEINQRKLFFIIGPGRSGTSLLQEIINTFSGFSNWLESRIPGSNGISCWMPIRKEKDFSFLENFIQKRWALEYFVEKTPDSILCLPEIATRFSNANYLFLERNPLKIALSQLNKHPTDKTLDLIIRQRFVENLIMTEEDLTLNLEQFVAKRILKMVKCQVENKFRFKNMITIRYENLVNHLDSELEKFENQFKIKTNYGKAKQCLLRPSYSSQSVRYDIKDLKDSKAIKMIQEACKLWNYSL